MWKRVPEYLKENILLLPNYLFLFDSIWMCFANIIKVPEMEKEKGSKKKGHHGRASQSQPMRDPSTSPSSAHACSPPLSLPLPCGPHWSGQHLRPQFPPVMNSRRPNPPRLNSGRFFAPLTPPLSPIRSPAPPPSFPSPPLSNIAPRPPESTAGAPPRAAVSRSFSATPVSRSAPFWLLSFCLHLAHPYDISVHFPP